MDKRVEITEKDLPIGNALDQYYTFLKRVVAATDKGVYLFNTITPFDIYDFSSLYNENTFANFSDIVVGLSPGVVDENQGISLNDSFSRYYADIIREASKKVERKNLSPEQRTQIKSLEADIDSNREKAWALDEKLAEAWTKHVSTLGLKPGTIEYDLEKINFYNSSGIASQLSMIFRKILSIISEIQEVQEDGIPAVYTQLIRINNILRSQEYKMYRPFRPQLEKSGKVDHWELAKVLATARNTIGLLDIVEQNEQILPFADLGLMFKDASRGFTISKGVTDVEVHDKDWSVSGSGSKFGIFKASASASYVEHIEQSVKSLNSIKFDFKAIHEIKVDRRDWCDTSLFELDVVKDVLRQNKKLAHNTRHVITSVVLARGLTMDFKFDEKTHYVRMKDFKASVSGGVSIGFVSFGAKGNYHEYDFKQVNTDETQTITFGDDPTVCRILALRYEQIHSEGSDEEFFNAHNYLGEYDDKNKEIIDKQRGKP